MSDVTLNSAVRSNLRTLQTTTDLMAQTEERLSTGKKVNSALDEPSSFFTAQSLDRRAGDLGTLLDNVSSSVQTIEAADNGISAISDLVSQMKSTARSAQQSDSAIASKASFTSGAITGASSANLLGDGAEVAGTADLSAFTAAAGDAGNLVLNGETIAVAAADEGSDVVDAINAKTADTGVTAKLGDDGKLQLSAKAGETIEVGSGSTAATLTALGLTSGTTNSESGLTGKTLEVTVGDGSKKTITFGNGDGEVSSLDELNKSLADANAKASLTSDGKLTIETTNAYASADLEIGGTAVSTDGSAATGEVFDLASTAAATASAVIDDDGKSVRQDYVNDYNDLKSQIAELAKDASYNGVNLLSGDDLSVTFNEDGSSKLEIGGVDIMEKIGLSDISIDDFLDSSKIDDVIDTLGSALDNLDSLSSRLGSQLSVVETRESFTKDMIGTLEDGSYALTGADTNEEAANLATLQTRQSLITSSLSISTSQEQNVLQLLR
ncbi:flagellin hook IN motif-containing protein [Methylopila sp. 73B]|uniref:flagellin N-terminal helical domain-containing protein n=1 Tax=Methylopila sp. 73B TaxID=1120792 RepID=UPI00035F5858|nr:flagellin hook IN motif-containing protein [Methylopila sp. 73B]